MPARPYQIPGGSLVLIFTCEVCGGPAAYGIGCIARAGLSAPEAGKWYCRAHLPPDTPRAALTPPPPETDLFS